jgi:UDP-glucose:(heptosyl)LPS alpha-1,3-glucosyltransferase
LQLTPEETHIQGTGTRPRLLVVSHPSVVPVNQAVYSPLLNLGWEVLVVVPDRWIHEYSQGVFRPQAAPELEERIAPMRVILPGRPQRHFYATLPQRLLHSFRPDLVFIEEECFSLAAAQWSFAARRMSIPFGVQADENLDRPLPWPVRVSRTSVLRYAAFVAARSPAAGELVRRWGATGNVALIPHAVPPWRRLPPLRRDVFTVGYAGRLVPEKGIWDLVEACRLLPEPVRLYLVGDGPLRPALEQASRSNVEIRVERNISHGRMPEAYAGMDVLVLPSRTTRRWAEQFGRVLVEALSCGVPVIGSNSGEIPWVIESTGGGHVFPEGDIEELAHLLEKLRYEPDEYATLAEQAGERAYELFGVDSVALNLDRTFRAAIRPTPRADPDRPTVALIAHGVHDEGGMERVCAELVRRGSDRFRFTVFSTELDPELRDLVMWKRIPVPRRPIPLKFVAFFLAAGLRLTTSSANLSQSVGAIVPNRIDLASVHFCHAGFVERTGSLAPPGRTVLRRINTSLARLMALGAERWSYRPERTRLLAAVSPGVASELRHHYPRVPLRITPNGIDAERFSPDRILRDKVRLSEGVAGDAVVALFVGGDWERKGLDLAINGIAQASWRLRAPLFLWVVGAGDESRFRTIIKSRQLDGRVRFFGVQRETERFYKAADIFVLPTLYETFSLATFEAAASGLPVIAPAVSGIQELVGDNEAGILIDRTPAAVGNALVQLAANAELRSRLGSTGRRRASEYTWEKSIEGILAAYSDLLETKGRETA